MLNGYVAHDIHVESVAAVVDVGDGVADGDGGHVVAAGDAWEDEVFDVLPEGLDARTSDEFGDFGEEFVSVEEHGFASQACGEVVGEESVGVVGVEEVGAREEEA